MIARVFDDEDARDAAATFDIDNPIAAVEEAAPAFADAALAEGTRTIHVNSTASAEGALELRSVVWQGDRDGRRRGDRGLAYPRGSASSRSCGAAS